MTTFGNFASPSSFEHLVNHNLYNASSLCEGADQQLEKQTAQCEAGSVYSIEHLMERCEVWLIVQTHLLEGCCDGAPPTSQEGVYCQYECLVPGRAGKGWPEML